MKTLKERLKWARKRAGKTQQQVAEYLHISQPAYSDVESGRTLRSTYTAEIARFLGVDAYWLATGEGKATPEPDDEIYSMVTSLPPEDKTAILRLLRSMTAGKAP